jgi:serine/threonine protein kinase/Tol biopolymer transport system component
MNPERLRLIEDLYHSARECEPDKRSAFLSGACRGDPELQREVESLLAQDPAREGMLDHPAAALLEDSAVMMLAAGARLGPYQIEARIGAGGMGEVYQARDTKLRRDVAIKVLPEAFAHDVDRLSRFQHEAKMLASLNHPNIATIHGLEQSGDTSYLVMELVSGETLAERVNAGALKIGEALKLGGQIAEALEAAHEKGVIHRDLKPANVKVTPEGRVKVLDFGLAKAFGCDGGRDLSNAPKLTTMGTEEGRIVGTPAYMSPEQARGKGVDKRTDLWAFGCVFYELLTGKRAFRGETVSDTIVAVLEREPDWQALPPATPAKIRDLLRRCMQKDVNKRSRDAGDVRIEIEEALAAPPSVGAPTASPATRGWREQLTQAGLAVFVLTTIALAIGFALRAPKPPQPMRLSAEIGANATLYTGDFGGPSAILSPDGTLLALLASGADQKRRIYVRALDQLQATALSGTENATHPFFSPDGQWLGFFADGKLKKISAQGGAAVTLCDAPNGRGGSWGDDGTIVFTPDLQVALSKVSSAGGTPQPLTTLDKQAGEITQRWPQVLPGGKAVLFTSNATAGAGAGFEDADIVVYSMASGQRKTLQRGGFFARYLPSGHVAYMHESSLFVVPFDLKRLEVTGQPVPILEGVANAPADGGAQFSFSDTGNLVYVAGGGGGQNVSIYWMDREGKFIPFRETPGSYYNPAFSPDGKRLALDIFDGKRRDIWVNEWERDTLTRLTFAGERNTNPVWTPDGQRIVYSSQEKGGTYNLWWIRADGGGNAQRLAESKGSQYAGSWRPDGKVLAFTQSNPGTILDIMTLPIEGNEKSGWKPGEPKPFLNSPFIEQAPAFSPDGRWLAYHSTESGIYEVYVRPFPGPGGKWQISTGGGTLPKWSSNGKELFYRTPDSKIMVITYTASGDSFHAEKPHLWSPGQFTNQGATYNFDLHPDGKRFAVLKAPGTEQTAAVNKVSFVFNFFDELRSKVPTGKK